MKLADLSNEQALAIKCAYADLKGSLEAHEKGDRMAHDWKAHAETLQELAEAFPEVTQ